MEGTRLESVEEIRQALGSGQRTATVQEALVVPGNDGTLPFRASQRPPMALLCILDDGSREEGEWVRLRSAKTVLGRVEGDVRVPHDAAMSSRHAEVCRQVESGRYRWYLTDLQSTNGTYVRVSGAFLKHGQELLIGGGHYRFDLPSAAAPAAEAGRPGEETPSKTRGLKALAPTALLPSLVEVASQGEGRRFLLAQPENWIGRDPRQCAVALPDDLLVSPRHAKIYRDTHGRWHLEQANSLNGTWVRIDKIPLDRAGQFQLGEQRFLIRFP